MNISVIDPINNAFGRMVLVLFKPFDIGKWFLLGFCAFLAALGEGGGSGNFPTGGGGGPGGGGGGVGTGPEQAIDWVQNNLQWLIPTGVAVLLLIVAIIAVVIWLSSRGRFMFIDGIIQNRGAVVEPWKQFRPLANSLFGFSLVLALSGTFVVLALIGGALAVAWPDIKAQRFDANAMTAIIAGGLLLITVSIVLGIIGFLLKHFVVPTMYARDVRVMDAWAIVREEMLPGNVGKIVLFFLMRLLLALAIGTAALLITCLTCCITAIPYIGTVILLPILVFDQCYTLYFVEQFGPQWRMFVDDDWPPRCKGCGYDLRGNVTGVCSECGVPLAPEQIDMLRNATDGSAPPPPPTTPPMG